MNSTDTNSLNAINAINLDQTRTPNLPVPVALQEANDLLTYCRKPHIHARLVSVGQAADFADELDRRIKFARQAQSDWVNVRDQIKSDELIALEEQAHRLRSTMIAAGRYNLRARESQATLSQIRGGYSVADLVQDLSDLSTLFDRNSSAFDADTSIDAPSLITESCSLSERLSSGVSTERVGEEPVATRQQRDRAFTYMDDFVTDLRSAGRYAFRLEPATVRQFGSKYKRRIRRARVDRDESEGTQTAQDVVEEEVVGESPFAA
jgi:hypothetical protein